MAARGVPAGWGAPLYGKLDADLAAVGGERDAGVPYWMWKVLPVMFAAYAVRYGLTPPDIDTGNNLIDKSNGQFALDFGGTYLADCDIVSATPKLHPDDVLQDTGKTLV